MLYPKTNPNIEQLKEKYRNKEFSKAEYYVQRESFTFFGYSTKRKFWYAIGKPISTLYFLLILFYATTYIGFKELKAALRVITFMGTSISFYFIVWAFWHREDFPLKAYYISIGVISVLSAYASYLLIVFRDSLLAKIKILTSFIVNKGSTYISKEDEEAYVRDYLKTFKKVIK